MAEANREQRRAYRGNAIDLIRRSKSYLVIGFENGGLECFHDTAKCKDEKDARHVFMKRFCGDIEGMLKTFESTVMKAREFEDQRRRVAEAKEKRSAELSVLE